jgi:hypothetical protein
VVNVNAAKIVTIANGVDAEAFDPDRAWQQPAWRDGPAFVFTGSMDYHPNIDDRCLVCRCRAAPDSGGSAAGPFRHSWLYSPAPSVKPWQTAR